MFVRYSINHQAPVFYNLLCNNVIYTMLKLRAVTESVLQLSTYRHVPEFDVFLLLLIKRYQCLLFTDVHSLHRDGQGRLNGTGHTRYSLLKGPPLLYQGEKKWSLL